MLSIMTKGAKIPAIGNCFTFWRMQVTPLDNWEAWRGYRLKNEEMKLAGLPMLNQSVGYWYRLHPFMDVLFSHVSKIETVARQAMGHPGSVGGNCLLRRSGIVEVCGLPGPQMRGTWGTHRWRVEWLLSIRAT